MLENEAKKLDQVQFVLKFRPSKFLEFSDYTNLLQENIPIMKWILPWGRLALDEIDDPNKSDDGPIWWIRPGEQSVSCQQGTPIKVRIL